MATIWGSAEYLGPIAEPVLPEGEQLLQDECGLIGHPFSSVWMGIRVETPAEMWFPD
jgi:hypothetical protein